MDDSGLLDWAENHARHQDVYLKKIKSTERSGGKLVITYDDKQQIFVGESVPTFKSLSWIGEQHVMLVTYNTKANLDSLIDAWGELIKYRNLKVFFINPDSQLEMKWLISPYIHNKICDNESLKTGLKSMFETVDEII